MMHIEVIERLQDEIEQAQGQEVLAKGIINPATEMIEQVEILARGHATAAPAITNTLGPATVLIHNHPSGRLVPSDADLRVASMVGNQGAGFLIIDNDVRDGYMVVEPYLPHERERLKSSDILDFFKPEGVLADHLGKYEYRPQQMEMVKSIAFAFNSRRHLLVEAGTGTGKSMAYLVPAIHWAVKNNEKVVVSTNTINLQEQLFYKDIPLLEKSLTPQLPREFKTVLVKGRRNYVCLRKLNYMNQGYEDIEEHEEAVLKQVNHLVFQDDIGSKSEFSFQPPYELWEKIAAEAETCLRSKCPHFRGCFLQNARREAVSADILIVNHHLLFADLSVRKERGDGEVAILPKYKHLILDEAHNLEHVATEYLGYQLSRYSFLQVLQFIYNTKKSRNQNKQTGLIQGIRTAISKSGLSRDQKGTINKLLDIDIIQAFLKVQDFGHHFFNQMAEFFHQLQGEGESKLRITSEITEQNGWETEVFPAGENLIGALNQLGRKMTMLYEELKCCEPDDIPDYESLIIELDGRISQLQRALMALDFILGQEDEDFVYWVEVFYRRKNELYCTIQAAPLEIAGEIKENLIETLDTVVFTSATLTVQGNFDFYRQTLGLQNIRVDDLLVDSPFDYRKQALLAVVKDVAAPNMSMSDYSKMVQQYLLDVISMMKGRTLVLFTAYQSLNYFHRVLKEPLQKAGIEIYKQGEHTRKQIIENFKEGERGVIFGTSSFWEGVDIPGDDLSCVVIMKLPFQVPSEPIVEARIEKMEREGKNSFIHFMLPNAVIKFKQGFGRLVRTKDDKGVVVVFDPRIYTKSYGKIFLKSLPQNTGLCIDSFKNIRNRVEEFIL